MGGSPKGYLPQRGTGMTAVAVSMEQWEQTMEEYAMSLNFYTAMSTDTGLGTFEESFGRVCRVRFIKCIPFDGDIEQRLSMFLDSGMKPSLTDKEYYYRYDYRYDAPNLRVSDIVLVPARDVITVAVVSAVNCQDSEATFSSVSPSARRTMKKVIGLIGLSPTMLRQIHNVRNTAVIKEERKEVLQAIKTTERQIDVNTQLRTRIATECKNAESMAKTLQDNLALYTGRLVNINRQLGE